MRWTWIEPDGKPQVVTFDTPEAAIEDMRVRQGWKDSDSTDTLMRIHRVGYRLALVRVTVEIVMRLDSPG